MGTRYKFHDLKIESINVSKPDRITMVATIYFNVFEEGAKETTATSYDVQFAYELREKDIGMLTDAFMDTGHIIEK